MTRAKSNNAALCLSGSTETRLPACVEKSRVIPRRFGTSASLSGLFSLQCLDRAILSYRPSRGGQRVSSSSRFGVASKIFSKFPGSIMVWRIRSLRRGDAGPCGRQCSIIECTSRNCRRKPDTRSSCRLGNESDLKKVLVVAVDVTGMSVLNERTAKFSKVEKCIPGSESQRKSCREEISRYSRLLLCVRTWIKWLSAVIFRRASNFTMYDLKVEEGSRTVHASIP